MLKLKHSWISLNFYTSIVVVEVSFGNVVVVEVETTEAIDVGESAIVVVVVVVEERISCEKSLSCFNDFIIPVIAL